MAIKLSTAILLMIVFVGAVAIVVLLVGGDDGASGKVFADDNENDLGLCLNYHQQNACDRVDINKIYKEICDFPANPCSSWMAPQIQQTSTFTNKKVYNQSNDEKVFPFPVEKGQLTFCYQVPKKVFGKPGNYVECNYVVMDKEHLLKVRDMLENWTSQK